MEITLSNPKEITVTQARVKTITTITVTEVTDSPKRKTVVAQTNELGSIRLWKDDEYDAIGQWTDTDVINRIKELYNL
tara:strand:+ start:235 stop:468 length:234 start_codon:yes stop_codon:yes gene_type:complete